MTETRPTTLCETARSWAQILASWFAALLVCLLAQMVAAPHLPMPAAGSRATTGPPVPPARPSLPVVAAPTTAPKPMAPERGPPDVLDAGSPGGSTPAAGAQPPAPVGASRSGGGLGTGQSPTPPAPPDVPPGSASSAQAAPPAPPGAGIPAPGAGYAWPLVPAPDVLVPFRAPAHRFGAGHRGVDLAGSPGQVVVAARGGTVVFAGMVAGRGTVSVQHDDGLRTTYEPVGPVVAVGEIVQAGAVVGLLQAGHPGCPAAACLHWGVRRDRLDYLDPLVLLRPPRVRLLPVPDPWPGGSS